MSVFVPNQDADDGNANSDDTILVTEEEGLPALSLMATLSVTLLGAAFASRTRRD